MSTSGCWNRSAGPPKTLATFGTTRDEALATKEMAYNQGFYNLFLGIVSLAGVIALIADDKPVGAALVFAGCGSMVAAGLVLLLSSRDKARAAITQLTLPLLAVLALVVAVL
jgi:putative membrane protein